MRSAEATMASRNLIGSKEKPAEQVSGLEEKLAEQVSEPEEKQVDQVSEFEEKLVDQVSEPEEKQVDQVSELKDKQVDEVSEPDGEQVCQASIEEKIPQVEAGASSKNEENEISIGKLQWPNCGIFFMSITNTMILFFADDVIVMVDTVQDAESATDNGTQSLEKASTPPLQGDELLTVKDLQPDKKREETNVDVATATKETKENVHKGAKAKKVGNTKRTTNKGKKKKSVVRARNETQKSPPFHAGLVPESKPPKGLARKTGGVKKKGNGKQPSPDSQEKTELNTKEAVKKSDETPPGIPVRVDSETGEVEHKVSPAKSEKTVSPTGSKTPPDQKMSVLREDEVSLRSKTVTPESNSSRAESDLPYEKTPSPRDKTPSPREQKACPRDRDAVIREKANENVNENVVTETAEVSPRGPSPEVVLTEKQRRANARAAQRRRQEVERKRREREEARRRAQDEEARLDVLRQEAEEEMKKREEERRYG